MHLPTHQLFTEQLLEAKASLVAHMVKNLCTMQETWVLSLGWEDHLEKRMATHSSILAWEISWTEKPGGLWELSTQAHGLRCLYRITFSLILPDPHSRDGTPLPSVQSFTHTKAGQST